MGNDLEIKTSLDKMFVVTVGSNDPVQFRIKKDSGEDSEVSFDLGKTWIDTKTAYFAISKFGDRFPLAFPE